MANEATIIELHGSPAGRPVRYTCVDTIGIPKGTLLVLVDERTVSGSSAVHVTGNYPIAGIAAAEKVANDGATTIAVYTDGIFGLTVEAVGATTAGQLVTISGANTIDAGVSKEGIFAGAVLGKALSTTTAGGRAKVKVNC